MNIVVDIGNTFIKMGVFHEGKLIRQKKVTAINDAIIFIKKEKPRNLLIASVNQDVNQIIDGIDENINTIILNADLPIPIKNNYNNPHTLGVDRLAASVGAFTLFPNKNILSIDIGTCITFDFIDENGVYLGGSISPGIFMKFKALNTFTSRLPLIEPVGEIPLIGKTTQESIQSGVINGTLAEIEYMIQNYYNIFNNLQIIICGGDAKFFESRIKDPIFVIPELVLIGLNRILEHNV